MLLRRLYHRAIGALKALPRVGVKFDLWTRFLSESVMSEPWDRPPLVREGDPSPWGLYQEVGRLLSQWEGVEIQLAYVHTAARGNHGDWVTLLQYGKGSAFKGRFDILQKTINSAFIKHPNQNIEAKLDRF